MAKNSFVAKLTLKCHCCNFFDISKSVKLQDMNILYSIYFKRIIVVAKKII